MYTTTTTVIGVREPSVISPHSNVPSSFLLRPTKYFLAMNRTLFMSDNMKNWQILQHTL